MYEFRKINQVKNKNELPSQAMMFDGKYLENIITGYRTLRVDGRETPSFYTDVIENISGLDGGIGLSKNLKPRYLTIHYRLKANTDSDFQLKYRELVSYLSSREDVEITFKDDEGIFYYGQVDSYNFVPSDSNDVFSSFTIKCNDPYKYGQSRTVNKGAPVISESTLGMKPDKIIITVQTNTEYITISNRGRIINLHGDYKTGDKIDIDFKKSKITKGGKDITKDLQYWVSDFHQFRIYKGDKVDSTDNVEVFYKDRWE